MRYKFGDVAVDSERFELRRGGRLMPTQRNVFNLIVYMVEQQGRLLTKTELLDKVWSSEVVSDSALAWCVSQARRSLGQETGDRTPIETVHGRGYRFVAEVQEGEVEAQIAQRPSNPPPAFAAPADSSLDPLIGRDAALARLRSGLFGAERGIGKAMLVAGEAGIGKTRLLSALGSLARAQEIGVYSVRCSAGEGAPAFWPVAQLVRQIMATEPGVVREGEALLTALGQSGSETNDDSGMQRGAIFERVDRACRFLLELAARAPRLIIIDDLQWSDDATLRVLWLLAQEFPASRLMLVGSVREPSVLDVGRSKSLGGLQRHAERIVLEGFTDADVAEYFAHTAGKPASAQLTAAVRSRTSGNPLLVQETVRELLRGDASQAITETDLVRLGTPASAEDVLGSRIAALDSDALQMMQAASVLGATFAAPMLFELVDVAPHRGLDLLDAAVLQQVIVNEAPGRYRFAHELLRELLYQRLSTPERAELHLRTADLLSRRGGTERPLGELARHYREALPLGTQAQALGHARAAAQSAARVGAHADAAMFLGWALEAHDQETQPDPRTRVEVLLELGTAQRGAGRRRESRATLTRAIEIAQRHAYGDLLTIAARRLRAAASIAVLPDPLAQRALESAMQMVAVDDKRVLTDAMAQLATIPPHSLSMVESKRLAEQSLAMARELGHPSRILVALQAQLYALGGPDDTAALLRATDEIISLAAGQNRLVESEAYVARFHALLSRGEVRVADAALDALTHASRGIQPTEAIWQYERLGAMRMLRVGEFEAAERRFAELAERARKLGLGYGALFLLPQCLSLIAERGKLTHLQLPDRPGVSSTSPEPHVSFDDELRARASAGRDAAAVARFEDVSARHFTDVPRNLAYLWELTVHARTAVRLGKHAQAEELSALLEPYGNLIAVSHFAFSSGTVTHFSGLLAALLDRRAQAVELLERAIARNDETLHLPRAADSRLALARLLLDGGGKREQARAREIANAALDAATKLGMEPLCERSRRLLKRM